MNIFDKLVLGTVQFGSRYGINNTHGDLTSDEINDILYYANLNGINQLDTADDYNVIDFLSDYQCRRSFEKFKIYSKANLNLLKCSKTYFDENLNKLNIKSFEGFMFHRFQDLKNNYEYYELLLKIKENGLIKKIGVSLYTNDEIIDVIKNYDIDFIQLPYNVFDNWSLKGEVIMLAKSKKIEIHVRSIFLQGLFFMDIESLPDFLLPLKKSLIILNQIAKEEMVSTIELLYAYVLFNPYIDKVLFGVDNVQQLKLNIEILRKIKLNKSLFSKIDQIKIENVELLHVPNWI